MPVLSATEYRQQQSDLFAQEDEYNAIILDDESTPEQVAEAEKQAKELHEQATALQPKIDLADKVELRRNNGAKPKEKPCELDVKEPACKVKIPASCRRHNVKWFLNREVDGMDAEHRAYGFARFLLGAAAMTNPGQFGGFHKWKKDHEKDFGPLYRTNTPNPIMAATEGGNAGIWVPEQFGLDIVSLQERFGVARQLANVLIMTSDKRTDPKEGSDPAPTFVGEGVEGTDVTPTDDSTLTLTAKKLMAILIESSELAEDAAISWADNMMARMARGFAKKEDQCWADGDGTSTYGGITGIRTLLATASIAGQVTGASGSDSAFSSYTLANLEQMVSLMPDYADTSDEGAVWVCHKTFYYQVMVRLLHAAGGSTGMERAGNFEPIRFMGFPVVWSNVFPKTAGANIACTFGNHRLCSNFGDRRAYSVSMSNEATVGSVNLWSSDQMGIKATERFDINNHSLTDTTDAGPVIGLLGSA